MTNFLNGKNIFNLVLIAAILFFAGRYLIKHHVSPSLPISKHSLSDGQGKIINVQDFKGKYVLVSYFQTWCGDCIRELPDIEQLQNRFGTEKLQVLLISDEGWEKINNFKARHNDRLPYYLSSASLDELGISVYPTTYLLDPKGEVLLSKLEKYDWSQKEVIDLIK